MRLLILSPTLLAVAGELALTVAADFVYLFAEFAAVALHSCYNSSPRFGIGLFDFDSLQYKENTSSQDYLVHNELRNLKHLHNNLVL